MKIIILIMIVMSFSGFAQEPEGQENKETKKVPEIGRKVLPQEQEENPSMPNPFLIGPYKDGKYIYSIPEEEAEIQE